MTRALITRIVLVAAPAFTVIGFTGLSDRDKYVPLTESILASNTGAPDGLKNLGKTNRDGLNVDRENGADPPPDPLYVRSDQ